MSDDKKVTVEITIHKPENGSSAPFTPFFGVSTTIGGERFIRTVSVSDGPSGVLEAISAILFTSTGKTDNHPFCSSEALCVLAGRCVRAMGPLGRVCND